MIRKSGNRSSEKIMLQRLIRQTAGGRKRIEPLLADHQSRVGEGAEQAEKRVVAYIEAAGIGAESGHDQPASVAGEAAPANGAAALGDARHGMQVTGNFAVRGARSGLVTKDQRSQCKRAR